MTPKKEAPTGQGQGQRFNTGASYHTSPRLSMAAEIILLALQAPDPADRLRDYLYDRLEAVLRNYYTEGRAGA